MSLEKIWSAVRESFQPQAASANPPELAEIRHDILEEIRGNVQELSAGRYVFPFKRIVIGVRPRTGVEQAAIQTIWIDGGELQSEILSVLSRADCQYDKNLVVETNLREGEGPAFEVSFESAGMQPVAAPPSQPASPISLSVLAGVAEPASLVLSAAITNLGRLREVFDGEGQFIRSNDLVFSDETVGRTHAHIVRQGDGRYALANSRRDDKTPVAIIRNGRSIPVILIPVPIQSGDVILLGRARITVT